MMRLKFQVLIYLQCVIRFKMSKVNLTSESLHVKILNSAYFQFKLPKITAYCFLVKENLIGAFLQSDSRNDELTWT